VEGDLVYSKYTTGGFPDDRELAGDINSKYTKQD
jgi:hypothetical protein